MKLNVKMMVLVVVLAGCTSPEPTLDELKAYCVAGNQAACNERDAMQERIRRSNEVLTARAGCRQGAEGEVVCD